MALRRGCNVFFKYYFFVRHSALLSLDILFGDIIWRITANVAIFVWLFLYLLC